MSTPQMTKDSGDGSEAYAVDDPESGRESGRFIPYITPLKGEQPLPLDDVVLRGDGLGVRYADETPVAIQPVARLSRCTVVDIRAELAAAGLHVPAMSANAGTAHNRASALAPTSDPQTRR